MPFRRRRRRHCRGYPATNLTSHPAPPSFYANHLTPTVRPLLVLSWEKTIPYRKRHHGREARPSPPLIAAAADHEAHHRKQCTHARGERRLLEEKAPSTSTLRGKAGQGRARQGRAGQGRARHVLSWTASVISRNSIKTKSIVATFKARPTKTPHHHTFKPRSTKTAHHRTFKSQDPPRRPSSVDPSPRTTPSSMSLRIRMTIAAFFGSSIGPAL